MEISRRLLTKNTADCNVSRNKKKLLRFLFIAIILFFQSKTVSAFYPGDPSDSIITILIKNTSNSNIVISYKDIFNDHKVLYENNKNDTIRLTSNNFIPLKIKYADKNVMFPLLRGDSLEISSSKKNDWVWRNINSTKKEFDTLFFKFCNKKLQNEYNQYQKLFFNSQMPVDSSKKFFVVKDTVDKVKYSNELYKISYDIYKKHLFLLDSLQKDDKISDPFISVYGSVITSKFINDLITCYEKTKSERFFKILINHEDIFKKEFLVYDVGEYKDMLYRYLQSIIAKGRFHKLGKNAITINYRVAFDSANQYFKNELLDFIQFICLKNIREQFSFNEYYKYLQKFDQHVKDKVYLRYLNENYINTNNVNSNGDDLRTINSTRDLSLPSLLKTSKGKILYIDIWASWCAPCRAVMSDAKKLQAEFSSKTITYIYLSVDENYSNWKNAAVKDIPTDYPFSYLLINPKQSSFLKQMNVTSLPRYIIFDKQGKMINNNAPGPDTKEIRTILEGMMNDFK